MANKFSTASTRQEVLGELAGAASVCWENLDQAGTFDSNLAEFYVNEALARLQELESTETTTDETTTEIEYEFLPSVSKDEFIRLECLHMACETTPLNRTGNEAQFIERARYFEQYIKNGAFENAEDK